MSSIACSCGNLVEVNNELSYPLPCPECRKIDFSQGWSLRIGLVVLWNLIGFADRLLTNIVVSKAGIGAEANPVMRALNLNPWVAMGAQVFVSALLFFAYIKWTDRRNALKLDLALLLVVVMHFIVILNNIVVLGGLR